MTVREKIDVLLQRGGLLMEFPAETVPSAGGYFQPCAHALSDHACILDHGSGHFRYLYDPSFPPPDFLPRWRKHLSADLYSAVLHRVKETEPHAALEAADHAIVFGTCDSDVLDAAVCSETVCFVFEPAPDRFCAWLDSVDADCIRNTFFIVGGVAYCAERIDTLFDAPLFTDVFPVFFIPEGAPEEEIGAYRSLIRRIETYYYRRKIYPLIGHGMRLALPSRELRRELFFDQQKHVYENLPRYVRSNDLSVLRGILPHAPAIIAAAGPSLDDEIDFIREHRENTVLICLNNGLKCLADAGIRPDIVLVVDPSVDVESCFEDVEGMERTVLVAHNYAWTAGDMFERVVFFGESLPVLRRPTPSLDWHGSVLTAGFSLAEYMGCPGCVLAGAQLCGDSPFGVAYSLHSVHGDGVPDVAELPEYLRLIPVRTVFGERAYTSHNFLDASVWLNKAVRRSSMPVGVLSRRTLVEGTGAPEDIVAGGTSPGPVLDAIENPARPVRLQEAVDYARARLSEHRLARKLAGEVLGPVVAGDTERTLDMDAAEALIQRFEGDNTAYLMQRFAGFSDMRYRIGMSAENGRWRETTFRYVLSKTEEMSALLQDILKKTLTALNKSGRPID